MGFGGGYSGIYGWKLSFYMFNGYNITGRKYHGPIKSHRLKVPMS